ncbi:hypothetical protein ABT56_15775 [Photobacterium aquae]|uniref:Lipoprotein n=1 Tax=Photobacterium aquae TaxID=1195763 RepID=A0A0J1GWH8_9GAMM|nr:DUF3261 domain-containing protein [Photobacterium aquae]KLV04073.1 hypothetical protein ABT56_15775 [Photobacterium aquae]
MNKHSVLKAIIIGLPLWLSGCGLLSSETVSELETDTAVVANKVEVVAGKSVVLPQPFQYGANLTASQLITATWQEETHQLPVQLEVTPEKIVLAGFSSWGTRLFSLAYQDHRFDSYIMPGLAASLPQPEQVLFNIMLTLWPVEAWQPLLAVQGMSLVDTQGRRQLLDSNQQVVIDIQYRAVPHLDGEIIFKNMQLGYVISIKTLTYSQNNVEQGND